MDPHVVLDCQKVLPNRFALTLAAAARSRALGRGAEPRLDSDHPGASDLALHEIAAAMFTRKELAPFLPSEGGRPSLSPPDPVPRLLDGGERAAAAPLSRSRETVH
ncbi:DNA-directed RNA polymerase subunit omega [uncultured Brevundimonas sp.]|uniref:DNA-directed RNA polymerase subunit omega n=1 Tax=uncultured Brevundimonas sp. TaxID=213418 RepID=UPI0025F1530F|nr:DNA-directed RNA polymerase subunit omega [uncultured Brevundimonas sp.]